MKVPFDANENKRLEQIGIKKGIANRIYFRLISLFILALRMLKIMNAMTKATLENICNKPICHLSSVKKFHEKR